MKGAQTTEATNIRDEDERSATESSNLREERSKTSEDAQTDDKDKTNHDNTARVRKSNQKTKYHDYKQVHRRGFNFMNTSDPTKVDKVKMAKNITGLIFAQLEPENQQKRSYYWKAGVRVMGEDAVKAIVKEVKQLDDKETFKPVRSNELTRKQRHGALESIITVTKK